MVRSDGGKKENVGGGDDGKGDDTEGDVCGISEELTDCQDDLYSSHDPSLSMRLYSVSALSPTMQPMGCAV